mgnify:FL=1
MKKYLKYIICLISSLGVTASSVVTASSENLYTNISEINNTNNNLKIIQESNEIDDLLKKKGIYDENEEVLAVIEIKGDEPKKLPEERLIKREIYTKYKSSYEGTKANAKYTYSYPSGSFSFAKEYSSGWKLSANLGLKVEVLEAALGYELNKSEKETFSYTSNKINYPFTVKAYVNYEKKYYDVYDADLIYDDYIGSTSIERETGYTIKITKS